MRPKYTDPKLRAGDGLYQERFVYIFISYQKKLFSLSVTSSLSLHWVNDLPLLFREINRLEHKRKKGWTGCLVKTGSANFTAFQKLHQILGSVVVFQ